MTLESPKKQYKSLSLAGYISGNTQSGLEDLSIEAGVGQSLRMIGIFHPIHEFHDLDLMSQYQSTQKLLEKQLDAYWDSQESGQEFTPVRVRALFDKFLKQG